MSGTWSPEDDRLQALLDRELLGPGASPVYGAYHETGQRSREISRRHAAPREEKRAREILARWAGTATPK